MSKDSKAWSDLLWRQYDEDEARLTSGVSYRMIELAELQPGMSVLDLATGRGEPAIRVAQFLGTNGKVVGVDSSEAMLRMAQERADRESVTNLFLHHCDAEDLQRIEGGPFDAVFARWGLMYMAKPMMALRQAAQLTRPRGKLIAALWAEEERVDYYSFPRKILARQIDIPPIDPNVPGTFYYADVQRIERDFQSSGWSIDSIMELYTPVMEAESEAKLIEWTRAFGLDRLLASESSQVRQRWEADMVSACHVWKNEGIFQLGGVTRLVLATRLDSVS